MDLHHEYQNDVLAEMAKTGLEKGWIKQAGRWYKSPAVARWQKAYNFILKKFPELQSKELRLLKEDHIYGPASRRASNNLNKLLFADKIALYANKNPQVKASLAKVRGLMQHDFDEGDKYESSIVFTEFWPEAMEQIPDILEYVKSVAPLKQISPFISGRDESQRMIPSNKQKGSDEGRAIPYGRLPYARGPKVVEVSEMPTKAPGPYVDPFERSVSQKAPMPSNKQKAPMSSNKQKGSDEGRAIPYGRLPYARGPKVVEVSEMPKDPGPFDKPKRPTDAVDGVFANMRTKITKEAKDTITQLVTLATELDQMGATAEAISIDKQLRAYRTDIGNLLKQSDDQLYDIFKETGESFLNSAHPEGEITIAPASEGGGVVETTVTEHKKMVDKATKAPTGKLASTVAELIVLANRLDSEGKEEAAQIVDQTIRDVVSENPFVGRSQASVATGSIEKFATISKEAKDFYPNQKIGLAYNKAWNNLKKLQSMSTDRTNWGNLWNPTGGYIPKLKSNLRNAKVRFKEATNAIKNNSSYQDIANRIADIIKYLWWKNPVSWYDDMFSDSEYVHKATNLHNEMLKKLRFVKAGFEKTGKANKIPIFKRQKEAILRDLSNILNFFNSNSGRYDAKLRAIFHGEFDATIEYLYKLEEGIKSGKIKATSVIRSKCRNVYNTLVRKLKVKPAPTAKKSSYNISMKKYAVAGLPDPPSSLQRMMDDGTAPSGTAPSGMAKRRSRRTRKNQAVYDFQNTMKLVGLGGLLGATGVDGIWGKNTAKTWNAFKGYVEKNADEKYSRQLPKASRKLTSNVAKMLATATKWAKFLGGRDAGMKEITFPVGNFEVSSKQLTNLDTFKGLVLELSEAKTELQFRRSQVTPVSPGLPKEFSLFSRPLSKRAEDSDPFKKGREMLKETKEMADKPGVKAQTKQILDKINRSLQGEGGTYIGLEYTNADLNRVKALVRDLYTQLAGGTPTRGAKFYENANNTITIVYPNRRQKTITREQFNRQYGRRGGYGHDFGAGPEGSPLQEIKRMLRELPDISTMNDPDRFSRFVITMQNFPTYSEPKHRIYLKKLRKGLDHVPAGREMPGQRYWMALKFCDMYRDMISHIDSRIKYYIKKGSKRSKFTRAFRIINRLTQYLTVLEKELKSEGATPIPIRQRVPKPKPEPNTKQDTKQDTN